MVCYTRHTLDHPTMPTLTAPSRTSLIWVGIAILYVVWGSTYLGIRIAVETIPPFLLAGVRFGLAGLVIFGVAVLRRRGRIPFPTRREWRDMTIIGAALMAGGMGLVALGEQTVPSGIAALLIAMMPLWVAVLGRVFFGERLPRIAIAGVAIGLVGVGILVGPSASAAETFDPGGILALLISPISWSIGSLYSSHRAQLPKDPLVATGGQMLAGSAILIVLAAVRGEYNGFRPEAVSPESLAAFVYLTVVGSLVAFTAYVWLLRVAPLPLIATYAYVNPIVAVVLGAIVLQEPITPRTLVAGAVIIFAVALIITARGRLMSAARRRAPVAERETAIRGESTETDAAA
jgi:drug/metabolite transporter (DMT)-like permease